MTKKLLLATNNPSKVREITASLRDLDLEILSLLDLDKSKYLPACPESAAADRREPPENGETFKENARIKAEFWVKQTKLPTLADDSGILVEALPGELGVKTVRFGKGSEASDTDWLDYFLGRMESQENRKAKFVCVLAFAQPNEAIKFFGGEVDGRITEKIAAPILPRIPLSSVFLADGAEKVFAAMSEGEKAKFSHRGKALGLVKKFIKSRFRCAGEAT